MKKSMSLIALVIMFAVALAPTFVSAAQEASTPALAGDVMAAPDTGGGIWEAVFKIVAPIVIVCAGIVANFTEQKPTDPAWLAFVKKLINIFALNFSPKAGT